MAKRNKRKRNREPVTPITLAIISLSLASIIIFFIFIFSGAKGMVLRIISGLSVIFMVLCIAAFILGVRQFIKTGFATLSKALAVVLPAIAAALWLVTYLFGILIG